MKGRMISICDVREGRGCARRWTKSQEIPKPAEESPGFRRPCSTGGGKGDGVGWTRVTVQRGLPWWSSGEDSELSAAGAWVPSLVRELRSPRATWWGQNHHHHHHHHHHHQGSSALPPQQKLPGVQAWIAGRSTLAAPEH